MPAYTPRVRENKAKCIEPPPKTTTLQNVTFCTARQNDSGKKYRIAFGACFDVADHSLADNGDGAPLTVVRSTVRSG